jgi:hypothetical protein
LSEPTPRLCTLVVASAFDAAIHDAYGKAHGISSYETYGPDHMTHDLGRYLDARFNGKFRFPKFFHIRDGQLDLTELDGAGLGVTPILATTHESITHGSTKEH